MKTKIFFFQRVVVAWLTVLLCSGISAHAVEFSADLRIIFSNKTESGRFYVKSDLIRMGRLDGPDQGVLITDTKKGLTIILNVEGKQYVELADNLSGFIPPEKIIATTVKKQVGSEKIGKRECSKYQYLDLETNEPVVTQWLDTTLNFPVKVCYSDENKCWQLSNIKQEAVDDEFFQVPEGYQKVQVKSIEMDSGKKASSRTSSVSGDETVMLIDLAKLEYTNGNKAEAALQLKYALIAVWKEMPFMVVNIRLVEESGSIEERKNNVYASGERIYLACQILGYRFIDDAARVTADFFFLNKKGDVLLSQKEFGRFDFQSTFPDPETRLDLNFRITDVSAGDYLIKVVLNDTNSGQSVEFSKQVVFE